MKIEITAWIDQSLHEEVSRALDLTGFENSEIQIDSVELEPFEDIEDMVDDGDGSILIGGVLIKLGNGIHTAASAKGVLDLVRMSVEKIVNRIRRADKTRLILETPDGDYNLIRTADREAFKRQLEEDLVFDDPAEIERRFSQLGELINRRFETD